MQCVRALIALLNANTLHGYNTYDIRAKGLRVNTNRMGTATFMYYSLLLIK